MAVAPSPQHEPYFWRNGKQVENNIISIQLEIPGTMNKTNVKEQD